MNSTIVLAAFIAGLCFYFAPWLVALKRRSLHTKHIFFFTLVTGWTGVGWAVAYLWAVFAPHIGWLGDKAYIVNELPYSATEIPQEDSEEVGE